MCHPNNQFLKDPFITPRFYVIFRNTGRIKKNQSCWKSYILHIYQFLVKRIIFRFFLKIAEFVTHTNSASSPVPIFCLNYSRIIDPERAGLYLPINIFFLISILILINSSSISQPPRFRFLIPSPSRYRSPCSDRIMPF